MLAALPLTPNAKVDRRALPAPEGLRRMRARATKRRATATEQRLAEIWSEVLRVERIGVHDDFFALGGHSLLAVRIIARIEQSCGAELSVRAVFEAPTVRALAARIDAAAGGAPRAAAIARLPRGGGPATFPLSAAQQQLWFLYQLEPDKRGRTTFRRPCA